MYSQGSAAAVVWRKLTSLQELQAISAEWDALNQDCGDMLFCSPSWQLHWIACYWQAQWQLEVWTGTADNKLVAILPCYSKNGPRYRTLFPLGQGEPEECEVASEFIDLLVRPERQYCLSALAKLLKLSGRFRLTWRAVADKANILQLAKMLDYSVIQASGARYLCDDTVEAELTTQLKRKWQKINRLERDAKAEFSWLHGEHALQKWPELKALHQIRWNKKGKPGAFTSEVFNQFHQDFIHQQPERCQMSQLTVNGEVAAIHYYLNSEGYIHFYQAGWSDAFARYSPSAMLHLWSASKAGGVTYDFMLGASKSYKQALCNMQQPCFQLDTYPDIRSYVVAMLRKLKRVTGRYKWLP